MDATNTAQNTAGGVPNAPPPATVPATKMADQTVHLPRAVSDADTKRAARNQKIRETLRRVQRNRDEDDGRANEDSERLWKEAEANDKRSGVTCWSCGARGHRQFNEKCMNYERDTATEDLDTDQRIDYLEVELFRTRCELRDVICDTQDMVRLLLEAKLDERT